jgi:hypothetical protein
MYFTNNNIRMVLVVMGVLVLVYAVFRNRENFNTQTKPDMKIALDETMPKMQENQMMEVRNDRPDIEATDLLPTDENTIWDQVNSSTNGKEKLSYKNFLEAGHMFGADTQGSSLRNANQQLRSEPLIKQADISPWSQSTIEPDVYRKPIESSCRQ